MSLTFQLCLLALLAEYGYTRKLAVGVRAWPGGREEWSRRALEHRCGLAPL